MTRKKIKQKRDHRDKYAHLKPKGDAEFESALEVVQDDFQDPNRFVRLAEKFPNHYQRIYDNYRFARDYARANKLDIPKEPKSRLHEENPYKKDQEPDSKKPGVIPRRLKIPLVLFDLKEQGRDADPHLLYAGKVEWHPPQDSKNRYTVCVKAHSIIDGIYYTYAQVRGSSYLRTELQLCLPSGSVRTYKNFKDQFRRKSLEDIFDPDKQNSLIKLLTEISTS